MQKPFDNGAAFFSRATTVELRQTRYTWVSNPFEEYPSRQLARVEDLSWHARAVQPCVASQLSISPLCRAEALTFEERIAAVGCLAFQGLSSLRCPFPKEASRSGALRREPALLGARRFPHVYGDGRSKTR